MYLKTTIIDLKKSQIETNFQAEIDIVIKINCYWEIVWKEAH